jgi:hypothetical protein
VAYRNSFVTNPAADRADVVETADCDAAPPAWCIAMKKRP